ncbi:Tap42 interacting protein [Rhizina undulata]
MASFTIPVRDLGKTVKQSGWKITTRKLPILNTPEIEALTSAIGIQPPEMIFGHNSVSVEHEASGWKMSFNAEDALQTVDKTGETMLQVAYSENWQKMRERVHEDIKEIVRPFDWSYTTSYKGTIHEPEGITEEAKIKPDLFAQLPYKALKQPDPILMFDDVMLYEDELADNGISILSVKVRVMPKRMLVLQRFFLRLDGVIFRVNDTRFCVEFETGQVIREWQSREDTYDNVRRKLYMYSPEEIPSVMRDANRIVELLPINTTVVDVAMVK